MSPTTHTTPAAAGPRPGGASGRVAPDRPPRARLRRRRARLLAGLLGVVVLAGTAEYAATAVVENRVEDALRPRLGETDADLSGSGLLALLRGRADGVTVTGDHATIGPVTGASVDLRLDGIDVHRGAHDADAVDSVHGRITVPTGAVRSWLTSTSPALAPTDVTTDPAAGTLRLGLGPGGAVTVTLRPELHDGRFRFALAGATVMGAPAPERLTRLVEDRLAAAPAPSGDGAVTPLPGLEPTSVRVTALGIEVALDGTPSAEPTPSAKS
ncbi:LmeA family phospholipid-binding protein [Streptomyces sp. NPDC093225]|uniref:LmeA family phospholipid-binding protein n=1 Tax=Streptomyces sp. NPDC093225 TaxID=3366034 RepID=UPI0037F1D3D1